MKMLQGLLKGKKRQKGNALVLVIIAIAFIGMLVAMIVYSAYGNFLMKFNDYRAKNNFYTAESVMDIINAGMQVDISDCMLEAYAYATSASESYIESSGVTREYMFDDKFAKEFKKKIETSDGSNEWKIDYFIQKYKDGIKDNGMKVAGSAGEEGAFIEVGNDAIAKKGNIMKQADGVIVIKNLRVTYTNDTGYVSVIQTDIRVTIPEMKTVKPSKSATLQDFCLIANDNIINSVNFMDPINKIAGGSATLSIGGNVNAGRYGLVVGESSVSFQKPDNEKTAQDYFLVGKNIQVFDSRGEKGLSANANYSVYATDIKVNSSNLELNGNTYVADDLDIGGKNSKVKLSGTYIGYGNDSNNSSASSAFLINGANTTFDLSGLEDLVLAGNTFIGATSYDADKRRFNGVYGAGEDDEIVDIDEYEKQLNAKGLTDEEGEVDYEEKKYQILPRNKKDLIMGGAVGAKAEQMLYLIPPECVGYDIESQEPFLNKNPMTKAEYDMLINTKYKNSSGDEVNKYGVINADKLDALGYTTDYKAVFRRVNGTVLVYLYIDFGNEDSDAEAFMRSYYTNDKAKLDSYVSPYYNKTASRMGSKILEKSGDQYKNLIVQGNFFYYDALGELQMIPSNVSSSVENAGRVFDLNERYKSEYPSRLFTNKVDENPSVYEVFLNTIKKDVIDNLPNTETLYDEIKVDSGEVASNDYKAIVVKGDYVWNDKSDKKIVIIVATGDVTLEADFNGLVISGKRIIVKTGCTKINRRVTNVRWALQNLCHKGYTEDKGYKLSDLFIDDVGTGDSGDVSVSKMDEQEKEDDSNRSLGKYITYDNWRKE
ncbi:MAG: hypothetical protein K5739_09205 [Lachnospiraceae bacterium]|nr:hypothetical protein [Lachnospiraceae bacterium]